MKYLSQNPGGGGGDSAETAHEEAEYYQRIEEHFGQRRGGPLVLSPKDWQLIQRWHKKGIPLPVVLRGVNQAFDRFAASGPRPDRLNTLGYCAQHVETAWDEHRRTHAGAPQAKDERVGDRPSRALEHLRGVALACRRAVSSDLPDEASRALERAAQGLEHLATLAEPSDLDAGSLDAAANLLEQQLEDALAIAWQGATRAPLKRRADLHIPRFSPYAV